MNKLVTAISLFKKNKFLFLASLLENFYFLFPDRLYLRLLFKFRTGYKLNLVNPKTFGEKIQWLKLYNRNSLYTVLVDKYKVKEYVANRAGLKYIIPTIGVWKNADEIEFKKLPSKFVLKTTNGGGGDVIVCKNKANLDVAQTIKRLNNGLKKNIYGKLREWPYKDVRPQIIAEKYLEDDSGELIDYKFYCFDGQPRYCQVIQGRFAEESIDFYDMEWVHLPFTGLTPDVQSGLKCISKPENFDEMISIAKSLSEKLPFIRVDLYNVNGSIFFGEMTFYPASGLGTFRPNEWNFKLGDELKLPITK